MFDNLQTTYCSVDRLYNVYKSDELIGSLTTKPTENDLFEMLVSDNWKHVFEQMHKGNRTRVSNRIYDEMLGAVPPIQHKAGSFYCGECYSGNLYYYFSTDSDGKKYGQLKTISK